MYNCFIFFAHLLKKILSDKLTLNLSNFVKISLAVLGFSDYALQIKTISSQLTDNTELMQHNLRHYKNVPQDSARTKKSLASKH